MQLSLENRWKQAIWNVSLQNHKMFEKVWKCVLECNSPEDCRTNTRHSFWSKCCVRDCIRIYLLALIRPGWEEREDIYAKKIFLQLGAVYKRWSNHPESEAVAPECSIFPKSSPLEGKFALADVHKGMQCYSSGVFQFNAMSSIQRNCELLQE